jgi:hypothetical protein
MTITIQHPTGVTLPKPIKFATIKNQRGQRVVTKTAICCHVWNELPDGRYSFEDVAKAAREKTGRAIAYSDARNACQTKPEMFTGLTKIREGKRIVLIKTTAQAHGN